MDKLEFTKQLVLDAGALIKDMMASSVEIEQKTSKSDLVTNVDKAAEAFLVEGINRQYQNQVFLTEEGTVASLVGNEMWIIDPIDGTTNFIYQKENFSISIAYFENEKPVFGIIFDVMKNEMFWGHVEHGAYCNETPLDTLDQDTSLEIALLSGDVFRPDLFKYSPQVMKPKFLTHRFLGSGALETAHVAASKFHAYVFPKITIWDVAAGMILLQCVGGTWIFGDQVNGFYFDDQKRLFIGASNQGILESLLENI